MKKNTKPIPPFLRNKALPVIENEEEKKETLENIISDTAEKKRETEEVKG